MNKILFSFLFIILIQQLILPASDTDKIIVSYGQKNLGILKKAKPVYVYFTFYKTMMKDESLDQYIKGKKFVKDPKKYKADLIAHFKKNFSHWIRKSGSKWEMKRIDSLSEAKGGYVLQINYDKLFYNRASSMATGYATLKMYPAGKPKNIIFKGTMKVVHNAWGSISKGDSPDAQFANIGIVFATVVTSFFKKYGK